MKRFALVACLFLAASCLAEAQNKKIVVVGMSPDAVAELQSAASGATVKAASRDELRARDAGWTCSKRTSDASRPANRC